MIKSIKTSITLTCLLKQKQRSAKAKTQKKFLKILIRAILSISNLCFLKEHLLIGASSFLLENVTKNFGFISQYVFREKK